MELSRLLRWVMCLCLIVTIYGANSTKHKKLRSKGRIHRCRCKRVYKEINEAIDTKFKLLEEKFLAHLPQKTNDTLNLQEINSKMNKLHTEVQITQESLRRESQALRYLKEHINSQSYSMEILSASFGHLENLVRNLTKVVERLGAISSPLDLSNTRVTSSSTSTTASTATTTAPSVQVQTTHRNQQDDASALSYPRQSPSTEFCTSYYNRCRKAILRKQYLCNCHDVYLNGGLRFKGDYRILVQPENSEKAFKVLCQAKADGGWTVFQRRIDGSENFYRNWTDYRDGFGNLGSEFWLGNKYLHQLTNPGRFQLRIDMEQWNGSQYYAIYDIFRIDGEEDDFKLHVGGYHGTAGDSFTSSRDNHNDMRFSTFDHDNDRRPYDNCAVHYRGGWWYSDCFDSNLNGRYYQKGFHNNFFKRNGIQWNSIHNYSSLKFVEMSVRPSDDFLSHNKLSRT